MRMPKLPATHAARSMWPGLYWPPVHSSHGHKPFAEVRWAHSTGSPLQHSHSTHAPRGGCFFAVSAHAGERPYSRGSGPMASSTLPRTLRSRMAVKASVTRSMGYLQGAGGMGGGRQGVHVKRKTTG